MSDDPNAFVVNLRSSYGEPYNVGAIHGAMGAAFHLMELFSQGWTLIFVTPSGVVSVQHVAAAMAAEEAVVQARAQAGEALDPHARCVAAIPGVHKDVRTDVPSPP